MVAQTIALSELPHQFRSCFDSVVSGNMIRITDADQEAFLISKDTFLFIVDCLQRYQQLLNR